MSLGMSTLRIGTFEELFECATWTQLGIHGASVGILNSEGYYTKLLEFLGDCVDAKLLKKRDLDIMVVDEDPKALLEKLESHSPPPGFTKKVREMHFELYLKILFLLARACLNTTISE